MVPATQRSKWKALVCTLVGLLSAAAPAAAAQDSDGKEAIPMSGELRLKDVYAADFMIGMAQDRIPGPFEHLVEHFNVITPENALKWESVQPREGVYTFGVVDRLIDDAKARGMRVIGHTLVWHNQTPAWVFQDASGNPVDRATLIRRMEEHIATVAGRYCDVILGWDVVNEAVADDGSMRQSPWYTIIGEEYIELAFAAANRACPKAELYYNDYGLANPAKRQGAVRIVKRLQEKGIRIDGVGIQGHFDIEAPSIADVRGAIEEFASLGVKVMITELDVSVYPWNVRENLYPAGLPDEVQQRLAERYAALFRLFLEYRDVIDRVTFWGLTDATSWKNNFPVRGRADYPLLFDRRGEPKPAFWAVIDRQALTGEGKAAGSF